MKHLHLPSCGIHIRQEAYPQAELDYCVALGPLNSDSKQICLTEDQSNCFLPFIGFNFRHKIRSQARPNYSTAQWTRGADFRGQIYTPP